MLTKSPTMKTPKWLFTLALGAAGSLGGELALGQQPQTQFQAPANSLMMEEDGKLEGFRGNILSFRDSKDAVWLVQVNAQTKINIAGEAKLDYLKPGMVVELTGTINEDAEFAEPVAEVALLDAKSRPTLGLFEPGDDPATAKPVREPEAGEYRVRARVLGAKEDELKLLAGRLKLVAKPAEDLKVVLAIEDPSLAQPGDEMKLKAWFYENSRPSAVGPGKALAESVDITLANPPVAGKRGR
jgi:hypothetical protein